MRYGGTDVDNIRAAKKVLEELLMAEPRGFFKSRTGAELKRTTWSRQRACPGFLRLVDEKLQKCTEEVALDIVNIYMRLCRTVTLAITRLKYFWTMRRMV